MTNEELFEIMKSFAAKANENGNLSFMDALDLISRAQHETSRVEDCVNWFCEVRKELVEGKKSKLYPHAHVVGTRLYNSQVVKAYADAYAIALDAKEADTSEDYAEVHIAVADALVGYFDSLYIDYLSERFGDDFTACLKAFEDAKAAKEEEAALMKELRSAKQSVSRLKKGKDADKLAEAEEHLADIQAKALELGLIGE